MSTRTCGRRAAPLVVALALLALPATAAATTTTVTFDDLVLHSAVHQYPSADPLVRFVDPVGVGFQLGAPGDDSVDPTARCGDFVQDGLGKAHSRPYFLALRCGAVEFPFHGTFAVLTDFASSVSAYVGGHDSTGATWELDAYDAGHHLLTSASTTTSTTGQLTPIGLAAPGGEHSIAYVALYNNQEGNEYVGLDDLSFTTASSGGPPAQVALSVGSFGATELSQASQRQLHLSLIRFNGSDGDVALSASGLPSGVHATFSPSTVTDTGAASTLTLSADPGATTGKATITLTATPKTPLAGTLTRSVPLKVSVDQPFSVFTGSPAVRVAPCSSSFALVSTTVDPFFKGTPITLALSHTGHTHGITSIALEKTSLVNPGDFEPPAPSPRGRNLQSITVTRDATSMAPHPVHVQITPSSGAIAEPSASVVVRPVAPSIAKVSPTRVTTPQRLQPGDKVTITGAGFCPGATVRFGNDAATATPDSISPDGTRITVRTPRLATDGPVTVTSPGGTATSPKPLSVDSYRNVNGYQFRNYIEHLNYGQMTAAFGRDTTYISAPWGDIRNPWAAALYGIYNDPSGLCWGFTLSSQRFIEGDHPRLSAFAPGDASDVVGLDGPAGPSDQIRNHIDILWWQQLGSKYVADVAHTVVRHRNLGAIGASLEVHQAITSALAKGHYPLVDLQDPKLGGHSVIAYDVEGGPPDWYVDVYDPNVQFMANENSDADHGAWHQLRTQASRIHIHVDGSWQLPSSGMAGDLTGLVVTDPTDLPIHPDIVGPFDLLDNWYIGGGAKGSSPAHSRVVQVTGAAHHTLYAKDGSLNADPHTRLDAAPFLPRDGAGGSGRDGPQAIVGRGRPSRLRVAVKGTGRGRDTHLLRAGRLVAEVDTTAARGARDSLTLGRHGVGFVSTRARKPLRVTLIRAAGSGRRIIKLRTTSFRHAPTKLSLTDHGRGLRLAHRGRATTLRLTLSAYDRHHAPQTFTSGPIHVGRGRTARLRGISWTSLARSRPHLRVGQHARRLRNHTHRRRLLSISKLRARRLHGRRVRLRVTTRAHHLPRGAKATLRLVIRCNGHRVARHTKRLARHGRSARYTFHARRRGRYTVRAVVTVVTGRGAIHGSSRSVRTRHLRLTRRPRARAR